MPHAQNTLLPPMKTHHHKTPLHKTQKPGASLTLSGDVSDEGVGVLVLPIPAVPQKIFELLFRLPLKAGHVRQRLVDGVRSPLQERRRELYLLRPVSIFFFFR